MSELENARFVRLLCKFGFINERPEYLYLSSFFPALHTPLLRFALEPRWSETGDRYIIKLFRDYVFHQVDEHGKPLLNMSHVLTCLNKARPLPMYPIYSIHFPSSWTLAQKKGLCWFPETKLVVWSSVTRKLKPAWRVLSSTSCPLHKKL